MKFPLLIFLVSISLNAKVDKSLCNLDDNRVLKRITPRYKPNYFFKTSPDGRYIFYIGNNQNWRLDTQTGEELLIPGSADPVPSVDGKVMTSINWRVPRKQDWSLNLIPMENWDIKRDFSGNSDYRSVTTDTNTRRTYQSVGTLGNDRYRILSYDEGISSVVLRDYSLIENTFGTHSASDNVQNLPQLRLPMISKDGREFSGLDIESNQTVIYKIDEGGSSSKEVERLEFPSGKADFSEDNSKIVFHVTETVSQKDFNPNAREVLMPPTFNNKAEVRNVFVYDRKTKSVSPVTQNKRGNSYYPVFLEDNRIVYLDQRGDDLSFVYSSFPKVVPKSVDKARECFEGSNFDDSIRKLAENWQNVCTDWEGSSGANKVMVLNISDELCQQIAEQSKDQDIALMCEALKKSEIKRPKIAKTENKFKKMVKVKCMICHQGNIPFFDKEKIKTHKSEILKRINSTDSSIRMPLGGELSKSEKIEFANYLNSL
ncbi:hypothetical protein [Halobacteriovorax sp.]|uniref:hypothetical protein n=1 Tax=Halobacteriovorax sp. TaxID=2020862 RepID=UPI0035648A59